MIKMMEFDEILKMAKLHGLTMKDLEDMTHISYGTLSRIKTGKQEASDKNLLLLTYVILDYTNKLAEDKSETKVYKSMRVRELEEEVKFLKGIIKTFMKDS